LAELPTAIGRYEVISRLGQGGMGSLYLAKDPKIGRLVAIKLVRQEFDSPDARQRFAREAQSAGTLRHPNIVTIFDVDEHDGLPYIAMEYVDGETLSEIVRRKAPYPIAKRIQWIEDLCTGLSYAHRQGVVHRDVKPANLMLDNEGTLKILDFGLARREQSKFTQSQTVIGTPNYMSPEQIRAGDVGPRSDIFSVGAVLYEVIACKEAFPGSVHQAMHKILYEEPTPLAELQPNIDRGLVTVLARALEKDVERRYQDLTMMKNDLAIVRQRIERQVDESAQTIVTPPPGGLSGVEGSPPHGPATIRTHNLPGSTGTGSGSGPRSSGSKRITGTHRVSLQKRRVAQIESHLSQARKFFDAGEFDKARDAAEQALLFDTEHPLGLQLMDEIAAEEERRQIAAFVAAARTELQQGRLEAAERIVVEALQVAPQSAEIQQLRETIETTKREIERARQVQDMLRRARARFSEGSFEGAIRAVGELLAIDPGNANALDLQTRAQEAIDARAQRAQRDAAAQAVVTEARALFDQGDKDSAIAKLEGFAPPHDLVTGFLASLRGEQVAEALPDAITPAPAVAPTAAFMPGRTDAIPGVHVGSGSRTPIYAGVALAVVVLFAVGAYVMTRPRADVANPPPTSTSNAVAPPTASPAPAREAPAIPPPAVVTPPASLTQQAPQNENDRDTMAAYKLLSGGDYAGASKIAAQIARRDPKYANLSDLRAQIRAVEETEKQRVAAAAAAAEAAKSAANTPAPVASAPAPAAPAPAPPVETTAKPVPSEPAFTVAPGGAFVAPSEPPSPALRAEAERPGIEAVIAQYANAVSRKDLAAASNARTFTQKEAESWRNIFKNFDTYQIAAKVVGDLTVDGDRATVKVEERIQYKQKRGDITITLNPRQIDYKLEKIGGRWHILPPS
jgi:serine/threonine protein kinase